MVLTEQPPTLEKSLVVGGMTDNLHLGKSMCRSQCSHFLLKSQLANGLYIKLPSGNGIFRRTSRTNERHCPLFIWRARSKRSDYSYEMKSSISAKIHNT